MSGRNMQEYLFIWKIRNFSSTFHKNGEEINSPIFEIHSFGGSQWRLDVYPRGRGKDSEEFISIFLRKIKNDIYSDVSIVTFNIEVIGTDGKVLATNKGSSQVYDKTNPNWGYRNFLKTAEVPNLKESWPEDILTIRCHMFSTINERATNFEAHTEIGLDRSVFLWNIRISDAKTSVVNKEFAFSGKFLYEISLSMSKIIKIHVAKKKDDSALPKQITCKLALINSKGNELKSVKASHLFETIDEKGIWEFPLFLTEEDVETFKSGFLDNDTLSLLCEFVASNGIVSVVSPRCDAVTNVDTHTVLHEDLKSMFHNHIHSDIKLKTNSEVLPAHKSVLAARSPVFSAMFDQDMIESKTGVVDVADIEGSDLKLFLEFIYTGSVENLDYEKAKILFVVADKYEVLSLTEKCSLFLESILSVGNVIEILSMSDKFNHERLKKVSIYFIAMNPVIIFHSLGWQDLMRGDVKLASEVISSIAENFKITPNN